MSRIVLVLAAACVALVATASVSAMSVPKLTGTVGPGFTITLKKGTAKVTKLKAGKYTIVVKDLASNHNFHLTGPGVNKKTGVGAKGTSTWRVTLKKGTYRYVCDPHVAIMKGKFTVS
jgi:plastocyanin